MFLIFSLKTRDKNIIRDDKDELDRIARVRQRTRLARRSAIKSLHHLKTMSSYDFVLSFKDVRRQSEEPDINKTSDRIYMDKGLTYLLHTLYGLLNANTYFVRLKG